MTPVLRRFATQQRHITWGASPFAAIPALGPYVFNLATEDHLLGRAAAQPVGRAETRHDSGRPIESEMLWLYALPNPHPERAITGITLIPRTEHSLVYGITATSLEEHPLVGNGSPEAPPHPAGRRRTERPGASLDVDSRSPGIGLDLGTVISARAALEYDHTAWEGDPPDVQPVPDARAVVVEYAAHPAARLTLSGPAGQVERCHLGGRCRRAGHCSCSSRPSAGHRPHPRCGEQAARAGAFPPARGGRRVPAAARPPPPRQPLLVRGQRPEFANGGTSTATSTASASSISHPASTPISHAARDHAHSHQLRSDAGDTREIVFQVQRTLGLAGARLGYRRYPRPLPQSAGCPAGRKAEGVNVVNLLAAAQWGEMFSNVGDFDGRTTFGAQDFGGDGEFLVRVGTGEPPAGAGAHLAARLPGSMIHPLSSGGPAEAAIGDPLEVAMAEWAQRCRQQGGTVVMPHAPNPQ